MSFRIRATHVFYVLFLVVAIHPTVAMAITVQLSWSATFTQTSLMTPGELNNLYVRLTSGVMSFKGAELDLRWSPGDPTVGCIAKTGITYKTSAWTTCTYLNRGTAVPVVSADEPGHLHVAWANSSSMNSCIGGTILQISFEFDGCEDPIAVFQICSLSVLDSLNVSHDIPSADLGDPATVLGGGSDVAPLV
jgi:hypothetical protein